MKTKEYTFQIGDSTSGPVGITAVVVAASEEDALDRLRELLPEYPSTSLGLGDPSNEYVNVYINAGAISLRDCEGADEACARRGQELLRQYEYLFVKHTKKSLSLKFWNHKKHRFKWNKFKHKYGYWGLEESDVLPAIEEGFGNEFRELIAELLVTRD